MLKTNTLKENLLQMNPFVVIKTVANRLTEKSIPDFFRAVDILAECFGNPSMKAAALRLS